MSAAALKDMAALPKKIRQRVADAIEELEENPRPPGHKKLKGKWEGSYRIRVGDYRAIYNIEDRILVVTLVGVDHRSNVYS